jgi:hypothetical protein
MALMTDQIKITDFYRQNYNVCVKGSQMALGKNDNEFGKERMLRDEPIHSFLSKFVVIRYHSSEFSFFAETPRQILGCYTNTKAPTWSMTGSVTN